MSKGTPLVTSGHRVISEIQPEMAKANLRKAESADALKDIGECLDDARAELKWTLDRLAAELGRDPRQVRRWIAGDERTQVDVVFAVTELRAPFVVALAKLAQCEVTTTIAVRRAI
jgi:glutathione S-transferase